MRPRTKCAVVTIIGVLLGLAGCRVGPLPEMVDLGKSVIAPSATIQADQRTVDELMVTFHGADEALRRQDLDALMSIYSKNYNYHGIDKIELRNIWRDLFKLYRDFSSTHVFSSITADTAHKAPTAEITCTGSLWAMSRLTDRRVNIDSWYSDVHHLVYEDGAWRIIGHAWEPPRGVGYVLTPHPFF
jgi:hypothetical protein